MAIFFVFFGISIVVGVVFSRRTRDESCILISLAVGTFLGLTASFWGGSFFVKKEIVVEKYFISPMIFEGKTVAALMEEHDNPSIESDNYIFWIKEGDETKLIKHSLSQKDIFFTLGEDEERYLKVKRSKVYKRNMWVWFFYYTEPIKSEVVLKKGDSFLTFPRYYSL